MGVRYGEVAPLGRDAELGRALALLSANATKHPAIEYY